jgi:hypothetical protein
MCLKIRQECCEELESCSRGSFIVGLVTSRVRRHKSVLVVFSQGSNKSTAYLSNPDFAEDRVSSTSDINMSSPRPVIGIFLNLMVSTEQYCCQANSNRSSHSLQRQQQSRHTRKESYRRH